jgi:hypothetical protein
MKMHGTLATHRTLYLCPLATAQGEPKLLLHALLPDEFTQRDSSTCHELLGTNHLAGALPHLKRYKGRLVLDSNDIDPY